MLILKQTTSMMMIRLESEMHSLRQNDMETFWWRCYWWKLRNQFLLKEEESFEKDSSRFELGLRRVRHPQDERVVAVVDFVEVEFARMTFFFPRIFKRFFFS